MKNGSHEETDDNSFEAYVALVMVFAFLYFYDNDVAKI